MRGFFFNAIWVLIVTLNYAASWIEAFYRECVFSDVEAKIKVVQRKSVQLKQELQTQLEESRKEWEALKQVAEQERIGSLESSIRRKMQERIGSLEASSKRKMQEILQTCQTLLGTFVVRAAHNVPREYVDLFVHCNCRRGDNLTSQ